MECNRSNVRPQDLEGGDSMSVKSGMVSLNGYEIGEFMRPLNDVLSIVKCAEAAAANSDVPHIEVALSIAADLLLGVKRDMENLSVQAIENGEAVTE